MRCYFMRKGHIAAVEEFTGIGDKEAVDQSRQMFEARKDNHRYDGFEVWDRARVILQYPPATEDSEE